MRNRGACRVRLNAVVRELQQMAPLPAGLVCRHGLRSERGKRENQQVCIPERRQTGSSKRV